MNGQIFISYRRSDTQWAVTSLHSALVNNFSKEQIFMDVDSIPLGEDFLEIIKQGVANCDVLIAVIGKQWLQVTDKEGKRMLDNPADFLRIEITTALNRNIRVIPVLLDSASMPNTSDLPEDLKPLSRRNAMEISHASFNVDVDRLVDTLKEILEQKADLLQQEKEKQEEAAAEQTKLEQKRRAAERQKVKQEEERDQAKLDEQAKLRQQKERKRKAKVKDLAVQVEGETKNTNLATQATQPITEVKKEAKTFSIFEKILALLIFALGFALIVAIFNGFEDFWSVTWGAFAILGLLMLLGSSKEKKV